MWLLRANIPFAAEGTDSGPSPAPTEPSPSQSPMPTGEGMPAQVRGPAEPVKLGEMTPSEIGRMMRGLRKPKGEAEGRTSTPQQPAAPDDGSADEIASPDEDESGTAPEEVPPATGETDEQAPEGEEPQLREPPRSWSAEAREKWANLDPELQSYLLEQDRTASQTVRKAQNEAAQIRQHVEQIVGQERMQLEQVRQQYEAALPDLYRQLANNDQFADIQSFDDVEKLAKEDWARYIEYDAHVKKLGIVQAQLQQAQQRQMQEYGHNWARWSTQEDQKFADLNPDMRDPAKAKIVHETGAKTLTDVGFSPHEINALWNGQASLSMRDHRVQALFHDAIKFRASKGQVEAAKARDLPAVQKPGVAFSGNRGVQALQTAKQKLSATGDVKDGVALLRAQRAARAGRAR